MRKQRKNAKRQKPASGDEDGETETDNNTVTEPTTETVPETKTDPTTDPVTETKTDPLATETHAKDDPKAEPPTVPETKTEPPAVKQEPPKDDPKVEQKETKTDQIDPAFVAKVQALEKMLCDNLIEQHKVPEALKPLLENKPPDQLKSYLESAPYKNLVKALTEKPAENPKTPEKEKTEAVKDSKPKTFKDITKDDLEDIGRKIGGIFK